MHNNDIAVVGLGFRFSGASTEEELDKILRNKTDCIHEPSEKKRRILRLDKNKKYIPVSYVEDIEYFDNAHFKLSRSEAENMDPQQKLSLVMAYEAIEDAGYSCDQLRGSATAVNMAVYDNYFSRFNRNINGISVMGFDPAVLAGRISYIFDFRGPAAVINTACSSSLYAVYLSCMQLIRGEADAALAGGVNINVIIPELSMMQNRVLDIVSMDGHTRCFDADADGTGSGEGGGIVMLKRLEDAERDKDHIYAVIKGFSCNQDGGLSNTLSSPSPKAQSSLILDAVKKAGIDAGNLRFIECHGTGTKIGDPIEIKGISGALDGLTEKRGFCAATGIKSNLGHLNMAAGIAGFIKAVISLKNNVIYPLANFKKPNPLIQFDGTSVYPAAELKELSPDSVNDAGVSAFGLSGTNVHIVIENYREPEREAVNKKMLFLISGRTQDIFKANLIKLKGYLDKHPQLPEADVSYTLCCGRKKYEKFKWVCADGISELVQKLDEDICPSDASAEINRIIFVADDEADLDDSFENELKKYPECRKILDGATDMPAVKRAVRQYALSRFLGGFGIKPSGVWGCGASNAAVSVISSRAELKDIPTLAEKFSRNVFDEGKFSSAVKSFADGKTLFVHLGGKGKLYRIISESVPDKMNIAVSEGCLEFVCRIADMGVDICPEKCLEGLGAKRISLPVYEFKKSICWPPDCGQIGADYSEQPSVHEISIDIGETETERKVAAIWCEVLGESDFTIDDDFFDLGGNSLMSMQLLNGIREKTAVEIEFDELYDYPTVRELAEYIDSLKPEADTEVKTEVPENSEKVYPVSFQQESMLIIADQNAGSTVYNLIQVIGINGNPDIELLLCAISETVGRNDILHTVYGKNSNGYYQKILDDYEFKTEYSDVSENPEKEKLLEEKAMKLSSMPFDLEKEIPIRTELVKAGEERYLLYISLHHIASDGWSTGLIIKEIFTAYSQLKDGLKGQTKREQYSAYAVNSRAMLDSETGADKISFWREYLEGIPEESNFNIIKSSDSHDYYPVKFTVENEVFENISQFCSKNKVSLFCYLISVYSILFRRYTSMKKFCIGVPCANRMNKSAENTVGFFSNTVPVVFEPEEDDTVAEYIRSNQREINKVFSNQDIPFEKIVSELKKSSSDKKSYFYSNAFAYQNTGSVTLKAFPKLGFELENVDFTPIKPVFDTMVSVIDNDGTLYGMVEYDDSFSASDAELLAQRYKELLSMTAGREEVKISEVQFTSVADNQSDDDSYDF